MLPLIPTLALSFLSFIASAFVILRIIIPILPPHPLSRRVAPVRILFTDPPHTHRPTCHNSPNLVFQTSRHFPPQTRATFGSLHAIYWPSQSFYGRQSLNISVAQPFTMSPPTLSRLCDYGLPSLFASLASLSWLPLLFFMSALAAL